MYKYQQQMLNSYNRATYKSLSEAYSKPSQQKQRAEKNIISDMVYHNGYDFRITSKSCFFFSCAFRYKDTENREHLKYFTAYRTHDFIIE